MNTVGERPLWSFVDEKKRAVEISNAKLRKAGTHRVSSFADLAMKVAELQFRNPSYVLLFRGQNKDHRDELGTSLKPSLFRTTGFDSSHTPNNRIHRRLMRLQAAERHLAENYRTSIDRLGNTFVTRYRIVRWSILQHYEACRTPLLDVSHSLRISTSFAAIDNDGDTGYLYVLAVPHISGAVTVCAEEGLQTVRLASVCPPSAIRPHLQEGYLLGEYPEINDFDQKHYYRVEEVDFGRRLVAKFSFKLHTFWNADFPKVPASALCPHDDPMLEFAAEIKAHAQSCHPSLH